ncbi:hypothetical protein [Rhodococcus sp. B50]|uniref:hypothetical protein n=1 Tax=Rhodococcus sp. B50 TaxID=2682847 RepID=UPI001BD3911B|nr:hypothetical protein [Rhodococcus sp. B50]MBS9371639.1 hypothetical protein [Rhodococcus sp. B50]
MIELAVTLVVLSTLAVGFEVLRRRNAPAPAWVRRAPWRFHWERPAETTRPRHHMSQDMQAAAEIRRLPPVACGAPHH